MTTGACEACGLDALLARREFLRGALGVGAMALAGTPLRVIQATQAEARSGDEKTYDIPAPDTVVIDRDESVIVGNFSGRAYAFSLACPHQNTALRWEAADHRFQCPKHHSRYQPDGTFIDGRATRGMDRFAIRRDGEQLVVNLDALYRQDENATEWTSAFVLLT